jgi:hypothetical protein
MDDVWEVLDRLERAVADIEPLFDGIEGSPWDREIADLNEARSAARALLTNPNRRKP